MSLCLHFACSILLLQYWVNMTDFYSLDMIIFNHSRGIMSNEMSTTWQQSDQKHQYCACIAYALLFSSIGWIWHLWYFYSLDMIFLITRGIMSNEMSICHTHMTGKWLETSVLCLCVISSYMPPSSWESTPVAYIPIAWHDLHSRWLCDYDRLG